MKTLDEVPGYVDAVARENFLRRESFFGLTENIACFEVSQITLERILVLQIADNPFLCGGEIKPEAVAQFLWIMSPQYRPDSPFRRSMFLRRCRKFVLPRPPLFKTRRTIARWKLRCEKSVIEFAKAELAINAFLEEQFIDRPHYGAPGTKSYYCDIIGLCADFGREYGWTESVTLKIPIRRIFQYIKEIRHHFCATHGLPYVDANRLSDGVLNDYMRLVNRKN